MGTTELPNISGVVLLSPLSDRLDPQTKIPWFLFPVTKLLVKLGWGNKLITGISYLPGTPKRFLSLFSPHSNEDTFDYGDTHPKMTFYSQIVYPLLVVFGSHDEYLDRPVHKVKNVFDTLQHSKKYKSLVVQNALHSYNGNETEVAKTILQWVRML